jgi:hypothetical protein
MNARDGITLSNDINRKIDAGTVTVSQAQGYIDELTPYLDFTNLASNIQYTIDRLKQIKAPAAPIKPNLGTAEKPPVSPYTGIFNGTGQPTTPALGLGQVANTAIGFTNSTLSHNCDFATDLIKNNQLKRFLNSQANNIREAVRAVMRALGFSDATGQGQWLVDKLKTITRALKYIQKNVIQPILDFEALVIDYVKKIQSIIAYILSLPARLLAMLQDCLKRLYTAVGNALTDIVGGGGGGFGDELKAAKEVAQTFNQTVSMAATAAAGAVAVSSAVTQLPNVATQFKKGI